MIIDGEAKNARDAQKALRAVGSFVARRLMDSAVRRDRGAMSQLAAMEQEIRILDSRLRLLAERET